MQKIFGTDGIRGFANRYPMTPELTLRLGQAIAYYFARRKGGGRIVIGKDTRRSSYMFEYALSAGISSLGSQAILTGPLPTPGIAFLTRTMRADAGVVISASHNNFKDNGIKFFDRDGFKLPDEVEVQLENFIASDLDESLRPTGSDIGRAVRIEDAVGRYTEFLKSTFPKNIDLRGLRIVIDCANGAGYLVGPMILNEMGAEVIVCANQPNGVNINDQCGALYPQNVAKWVKKHKADIGIALDGDADRLIVCDEKGQILDGDHILALCALEWQKRGQLAYDTVVGTVMTNMGLDHFFKQHGIKLVRTKVGDRYIMQCMKQQGYNLGGEPSGHLMFLNLATTGDALIAALQVLACMIDYKKPLSELSREMNSFPQKLINLKVAKKRDLATIQPVQKVLRECEAALKNKGRIVLRYSGTEPLLRLMIEAENSQLIEQQEAKLSQVLTEHL